MGSSNNFYQQALQENKLLQMKILELKHKAALYEVCLGSIASILKDLPLQQNINDTRQSQNAALHKIANVLTHIESVVKSNSGTGTILQLHSNPVHSPLHQYPSKVQFSWLGNNTAGRRFYTGPRYPPTEMHINSSHPPSSTTTNFAHGELQAQPSPTLNKAGSPQPLDSHEFPQHVSTLSIQKCMKSPESQHHTMGAMTISPIKISQNYPAVLRRSMSSTPTKPFISWAPPQTTGVSHLIERKRAMPREAVIFDELLRKRAAAAANAAIESAVAQNLKTILKPEIQNHNVYKQSGEHDVINQQQQQQQKNVTTPNIGTCPQQHSMMMVQSGNPFLQEKNSDPQDIMMINGGNKLVNMNNIGCDKTDPKWHPGIDFYNNNCNGSGKLKSNTATSIPVSSYNESEAFIDQLRKNFQANRSLTARAASSSVGISANQIEQQSQSDSDCTILN